MTFNGVTVKGAADLKGYPVVTSKETTAPTKVEVKDLVVGTGKAATPTVDRDRAVLRRALQGRHVLRQLVEARHAHAVPADRASSRASPRASAATTPASRP